MCAKIILLMNRMIKMDIFIKETIFYLEKQLKNDNFIPMKNFDILSQDKSSKEGFDTAQTLKLKQLL